MKEEEVKTVDYKEVFRNIYEKFGFGGEESRSGMGSDFEATRFIRKKLIALIRKLDIKSIVDIPCGDFNWMSSVLDNVEIDSYIGGDIVENLIEINAKNHTSTKVEFRVFDIIEDEIPRGDLLIVRDVLGHLPLDKAKRAVENILKSKCKYLLTTSWFNEQLDWASLPDNINVDYGRFYPVNLLKPPFNFPLPSEVIIEQISVKDFEVGNRKSLSLWQLEALNQPSSKEIVVSSPYKKVDSSVKLTIVSGLWDIGRMGREFETHYIPRFKEFLKIPFPMILFLPKDLHEIVWDIREESNTQIIPYELGDIKKMYDPHWDKTQEIRISEKWLNMTGEGGWLKSSPQALLEWYNPIVQSKMFLLHDASIFNTFETEYYFWLDAGITNTVPATHLVENNCLKNITEHADPFLFLSYPYESNDEIHGFDVKELNRIAGEEVKYVCRGGLFGGRKEQIGEANGIYYGLLADTLNRGYMGTEESIFLLMSYLYSHTYKRYMLDENGLIVKFTEALINDTVELEEVSKKSNTSSKIVSDKDVEKVKTNLYVLTFNFPEQLEMLMSFFERSSEWLTEPKKFLIDNSTKKKAIKANKKIAKEYGFEYLGSKKNLGINGGRQKAAEHFDKSDADYMFFFEDDMTLNTSEETGFCRNGFRKYIPNLYNRIHKVIKREGYDFVKLSFTEVFMDNNIQCSWYNVPQHVREEFWPDYSKLPVTGLDPNAPLTNFNNIKVYDELSYVDGEIYYCNWPMIVSKEGNRKMFIETKWAHVFEQTLMSHIFSLTKEGRVKPAVLLLSPITHDRQHFYKAEERREN